MYRLPSADMCLTLQLPHYIYCKLVNREVGISIKKCNTFQPNCSIVQLCVVNPIIN